MIVTTHQFHQEALKLLQSLRQLEHMFVDSLQIKDDFQLAQ